MNRPGLTSFPIVLLLLMLGLNLLGPAPAEAQLRLNSLTVFNNEGEPTDPEEVIAILDAAEFDVDVDTDMPQDEAEAQSWFDSLVELLRQLGLLPQAEGERGS